MLRLLLNDKTFTIAAIVIALRWMPQLLQTGEPDKIISLTFVVVGILSIPFLRRYANKASSKFEERNREIQELWRSQGKNKYGQYETPDEN